MAIYRVPINIAFTGPGSPGVNVWHVRTDGGFDAGSAQLQGCIDLIREFYDDVNFLMAQGNVFTLGTVTEEGTGNEASPTWTSLSGGGTAGSAPQMLCVVVTWKTSIAARRGRGRTFLGPLASHVVQSDGSITDAQATTVRTAAGALVTASEGFANGAVAIWGLENAATGENPDYPNLPHVARDITGHKVGDQFGVLRSRRD